MVIVSGEVYIQLYINTYINRQLYINTCIKQIYCGTHAGIVVLSLVTWKICVGGGAALASDPSPSMTSSTSCLACDRAKSSYSLI